MTPTFDLAMQRPAGAAVKGQLPVIHGGGTACSRLLAKYGACIVCNCTIGTTPEVVHMLISYSVCLHFTARHVHGAAAITILPRGGSWFTPVTTPPIQAWYIKHMCKPTVIPAVVMNTPPPNRPVHQITTQVFEAWADALSPTETPSWTDS
jgi:hypothetical protein